MDIKAFGHCRELVFLHFYFDPCVIGLVGELRVIVLLNIGFVLLGWVSSSGSWSLSGRGDITCLGLGGDWLLLLGRELLRIRALRIGALRGRASG